ncbi:MAG: hypothetical protein ACYDD0_06025 [Candidatus Dormibacteria bacterium]
MARDITQPQLRNASGQIMREPAAGETFMATRNGVPVGEPAPLRRRRFVTAEAVIAMSKARRASTWTDFAPTSSASPPRPARRVPEHQSHPRGLVGTSAVVGLERLEVSKLPLELAVSAITMAELAAGPHAPLMPPSAAAGKIGSSAPRPPSIRFRPTSSQLGRTGGSTRQSQRPGARHREPARSIS